MREPTSDHDKLWHTLNAIADNRLDDVDKLRLRDWLRAGDEARETFCEFMALHAQLRWQFTEPLTTSDFSVDTKAKPPAVGFLSRAIGVTRRSVLAATLLTALAMYGTFGFIVWQMSRYAPTRQPDEMGRSIASPASTINQPVARLVDNSNCRWKTRELQELREGDRLRPGILQLVSGLVQLEFNSGAHVTIEGPCNFELQTAGKGYLRSGKLAAHVPPAATGFEIETPTARVVDLGTDFRLEVSHKETRLAVVAGKVDLFPVNTPSKDRRTVISQSRRVEAGQAVAVTASDQGSALVRNVKFDGVLLAAKTPTLPRASRVHPVVAYQAREDARGNQRDFPGGVGLDFDVRTPIRLFSLGVFDHLGDGIDRATSPIVQLWSRDSNGTPNDTGDDRGEEVLATQVFSSHNGGKLKQGHRFKSLSEPIELPVGSYSIVAYGLSSANPFIAFENTSPNATFVANPGWIGVGNSKGGNKFGWSSTNHAGEKIGEVGGMFARSHRESSYGDTTLSRTFTLNDPISASGSFYFSDALTMDGQFFIGHYSTSTNNGRREFIGMEFLEGPPDGDIQVRARMYRPTGDTNNGAISSSLFFYCPNKLYFEYAYDPTYEADGTHAGPEGKVTLRIYNEALTFDRTVSVALDGSQRDSGAVFDAFGMGITAEAASSDDAHKTARAFIDDVSYSGFRATASSRIGEPGESASARIDTWRGAIAPIGSRFGEGEPGVFPATKRDKVIGYAAGSFEYYPKTEGRGQQAVDR